MGRVPTTPLQECAGIPGTDEDRVQFGPHENHGGKNGSRECRITRFPEKTNYWVTLYQKKYFYNSPSERFPGELNLYVAKTETFGKPVRNQFDRRRRHTLRNTAPGFPPENTESCLAEKTRKM